jgi:hypothetical protein
MTHATPKRLRLGGHGPDFDYIEVQQATQQQWGKQPEAHSGARPFDFDCVQWRPQVITIRACLS